MAFYLSPKSKIKQNKIRVYIIIYCGTLTSRSLSEIKFSSTYRGIALITF